MTRENVVLHVVSVIAAEDNVNGANIYTRVNEIFQYFLEHDIMNIFCVPVTIKLINQPLPSNELLVTIMVEKLSLNELLVTGTTRKNIFLHGTSLNAAEDNGNGANINTQVNGIFRFQHFLEHDMMNIVCVPVTFKS